jgi:hypothetical protein
LFFFPLTDPFYIDFGSAVFWLGEWKFWTARQFGECLEKILSTTQQTAKTSTSQVESSQIYSVSLWKHRK